MAGATVRSTKVARPKRKTELAIVSSQPPAEIFPALPALPVFEEHISALLGEVTGFACLTVDNFSTGAKWRGRAIELRNQIIAAFKPRKQAFDAAKEPTLEAENAYLAQINFEMGKVDGLCIGWHREVLRRADEEAETKRRAEIARQKKEREERVAEEHRKADVLTAWGDPEGANAAAQTARAIEAEIIVPPRPTAPEIPTYARGVRTAPKLIASIVNPSAVNRQFCIPSQSLVNAKVKTFSDFNKQPTDDQLTELATEIGGIKLEWS